MSTIHDFQTQAIAVSNPKGYVDAKYLQTTGNLLKHFKRRTYGFMDVQVTQKVLDVGCGPGSDTIALAHLVGPYGEVAGVDYDPQMIVEADMYAQLAGVSDWVSHKQGTTDALPYATDYFDASRSERVFQHLHNPQQALAEMVRVTKPGGRVVVWDADWGTLSIDTDEVETERKLVRMMTETTVNNGYSGRQLYRLFKQNALNVVKYEANTLFFHEYALMRSVVGFDYVEELALAQGTITQAELDRWHASLEQADQNGWFFASVTCLLIAGEKR
jgi:ubiquinone/menaquinone biosynthesis C-methylase UbiE